MLSELEHLLAERGCPACTHVTESERSFFSWFEIESFNSAEMRTRVRSAMGMCTAHSRRLVDEIGEGHIMTTVMREAVAGARECLAGDLAPGRCPACEAGTLATERALHLLLDGLLDPANARLYAEHTGLCLPHLLQAAALAEAPTLKLLAERLMRELGGSRR